MNTDTPEAQVPEAEITPKTDPKKTPRSSSRPTKAKKAPATAKSIKSTITAETSTSVTDSSKAPVDTKSEGTESQAAKVTDKPARKPATRRPPKKKETSSQQPLSAATPDIPAPTDAGPFNETTTEAALAPETSTAAGSPEVKKKRRSSSRRSRNKKSTPAVQTQESGDSANNAPEAPVATAILTNSPAQREVSENPAESLPETQAAPANDPPASTPVKKTGRKRKRGPRKKASTATPTATSQVEPEKEEEIIESTDTPSADEESKPRSIKLLINADEPEECRVALLENGKLESFHVETMSREQHKGNIYKGRIVSIETNLQAAFVDLGTGKNGFLPFSEIHPEFYNKEVSPDSHWKSHKMKEVLSEGQEVMVEVVKDVTGNKGASLTTYLSLPGRYVVLMPGSDSHGISKKIDKESERQKLREMLESCNIPEGVGYIIRTASDGITKAALTNDVRYQINLWQEIKEKAQTLPAPALLYKEQSVIDRFLRDHFSAEIEEILVDSQEAYDQVDRFLALLPAIQRKKTRARLHKGPRPLLNSHNIEEQIDQIFRPTVKLPSGGSIVINPTEALVSIDVNSGSTGRDKNFEDTIFLANMEAAEELARQLRLRDLGGLIVVDFIDMRPMSHIKEVEKKVKNSMKRDKAKVDFTRISKFGLMEISRQRMGAPIQTGNYQTCEYCEGHGIVRSVETQALAFLRQIQTGVTRKNVATVHCHLPMEVGQYLLNKKRADLAELERDYKVSIVVETDATLKPAQAKIEFVKERS
ncbi:MAG: Rne/Rng family ribonuclease [Desulfobulbaceae bacterium]|nr:Rne/Rng family ribonuclease [Desulfobulbaceae bacterium]